MNKLFVKSFFIFIFLFSTVYGMKKNYKKGPYAPCIAFVNNFFDAAKPTMYLAAKYRDEKKLLSLLGEQGANPDVADYKGNTPLFAVILEYNPDDFDSGEHLKEEQECLKIMKILLNNGADPSIKNKKGLSLLSLAAQKGFHNIEKLIKDHMICPATKYGDVDTLLTLLQKKIDPNTKNYDGNTPLFITILSDCGGLNEEVRLKMIKVLLKYGADPNIRIDGKTILDLAKEKKFYTIVAILEEECPICFYPFADYVNYVTPCGHWFHKHCLNRIDICPMCRRDIQVKLDSDPYE